MVGSSESRVKSGLHCVEYSEGTALVTTDSLDLDQACCCSLQLVFWSDVELSLTWRRKKHIQDCYCSSKHSPAITIGANQNFIANI